MLQLQENDRKEILAALIKNRFYNPHDVFHHPPEFYACPDEKYICKIHLIKWNTKSTRMTVLYCRKDANKGYVFSTKPGLKRTPHGEKMR